MVPKGSMSRRSAKSSLASTKAPAPSVTPGALLAAQAPLVLLLARDTALTGAVATEADHVHVLKLVQETVLDHGLYHRRVAHACPPPGLLQEVRGVRHALHTAGEEHVVVAAANHGLRKCGASHTRGADLVQRLGGQAEGQPRVEVRLPGGDLADPRLHDDAEDRVLYLPVLDAGSVDCLPDRRPPQLRRAQRRESPAELCERRPRRPE